MTSQQRSENTETSTVKPRPSDTGAAAVEFALLLPVLIAVVFAIVQFGYYYNTTIELSAGAREGARSMAIGKQTSPAQAVARDAAANACQVAGDPCVVTMSTATDTCPAGTNVTVLVTRQNYTINIPPIPNKVVKISAKAVMRCGG